MDLSFEAFGEVGTHGGGSFHRLSAHRVPPRMGGGELLPSPQDQAKPSSLASVQVRD